MIRSSIDIGTNTVLLLVAERTGGELKVMYEEQRTPRLGKGVDSKHNLHPDSIGRVLKALKEYQQILSEQFPEAAGPVTTATSAVRDANNREVFINRILEEGGIRVNVLSGEQEADYTYAGALSALPKISGPVAVLDIGGGSTEVAIGEGLSITDRHSFNIGSVRFTERYLTQSPPTAEQLRSCRIAVRNQLDSRRFHIPNDTILVGVAGTVTSLAFMELGLEEYNVRTLNGIKLSIGQLQKWLDQIEKWPVSHLLQKYPVVMKGRADVFLAGLLILEGFMETYGLSELTVSTGGIRHGVLANP